MKVRKKPERLCIGCHEVRLKRELVRIVRSPEGEFSIDANGKKPGRGAYVCRSEECFDSAVKRGGFERSFKSTVPEDVIIRLRHELFIDGAGS